VSADANARPLSRAEFLSIVTSLAGRSCIAPPWFLGLAFRPSFTGCYLFQSKIQNQQSRIKNQSLLDFLVSPYIRHSPAAPAQASKYYAGQAGAALPLPFKIASGHASQGCATYQRR
jgi:hypothetical protein